MVGSTLPKVTAYYKTAPNHYFLLRAISQWVKLLFCITGKLYLKNDCYFSQVQMSQFWKPAHDICVFAWYAL